MSASSFEEMERRRRAFTGSDTGTTPDPTGMTPAEYARARAQARARQGDQQADDGADDGEAPGDTQPSGDGDEGTTAGTDDPATISTPFGATPQTPGRTAAPEPPTAPTDPSVGQGIEADPADRRGSITPSEAEAARQREQEILAQNPGLTEEDIAITEGGGVRTTEAYRQSVRESRQELLADPGTGASRQAFARAQQAENRLEDFMRSRQELLADPGTGRSRQRFARAEQARQDMAEALGQLDVSVEEQVAAEQAEVGRAGAAAGATSVGELDPENLQPGEDYTVGRTAAGGFTASLTREFRRGLVRETAEAQLEQRLAEQGSNVDLDPNEDIQINDEGRATLTESGQRKIRADPPESFGEGGVIPENWEPDIRRAAASYSQTADDLLQPIDEADEGDIVLETAIDDALRAAGATEAEAERAARIERRGARTALMLGNVPGVVMGLEEGVETTQYLGGAVGREVAGGGGRIDPEFGRWDIGVNPVDQQPETFDIRYDFYEGGEIGRAGEAAGQLGRRAGEFARERPGEAVAALGGSLVGSYAIMGAASRVSSRAGLVSRALIQPGEELVGYGAYYGTRAVAGARAANIVAPGGELRGMREEDIINPAVRTARRGLRTVSGAGSRAASRAGTAAARVEGDISARAAEVSRRSPSLRVETDPDAGLIEVSPEARAQVRESLVDAPARRLRSGAETVVGAPMVAARAGRRGAVRAAAGARAAGETAAGLPRRAVEAPGEAALGYRTARSDLLQTGPDPSLSFEAGRRAGRSVERVGLRADRLGYRAGVATGEAISRAADFPSTVRAAPGEFGLGFRTARSGDLQPGPGASLSFEAGRRTGATIEGAARRADAFGYRAGLRTGETLSRIEDAPQVIGQGITRAQLRAEDAGFRAGVRVGEGINTIESLPGRAANLPSAGLAAAAAGAETAQQSLATGARLGRQGITRANLAAEDAGFRAGVRTGEAIGRIEGFSLPGFGDLGARRRLGTAARRTRAAPREFGAGLAVGAGQAGLSDVPRFEAYPGQLELGRAFGAGRVTGATARAGAAGLLAAGQDIRGGVRRGLGRVRDARDITFRVEPGIPRRPRDPGNVFDMGDPDDLGRLYDELGIDLSRTEGRTGGDAGDADIGEGIDAGGAGGQVAVARGGGTAETGAGAEYDLGQSGDLPMGVEGGAEARTPRPSGEPGDARLRTELGISDRVVPWQQRGQVVDPITITTGGALVGVSERPFIGPRLGIEPRTDIGVRERTGTRMDTGFETRFDTRQDTRLEVEAEAETEAEAEAEAESEFEAEAEPSGDQQTDTSIRFPGSDQTADDTGASDRFLGAGWLNRYATALAGGGIEARQAPENLEAIAERRGTALPLPTRGQVDPDEQLQEGLENVQSFFFRDGQSNGGGQRDVGVSDDDFLAVGMAAAEEGGSTGSNPGGDALETGLDLGFGGGDGDFPDLLGDSE